MAPAPTMADLIRSGNFLVQQHGHKDMVESVEFNTYGNRFVLGSADGRLKVYDKIRDGSWRLCDTWGAHAAEITEVHWLPSTIQPALLASISRDGTFKLWIEDVTISPLSGRRFCRSSQPYYSLRSSGRSPYLSFAFKHFPSSHTTFLALLDRSALLTVYENDVPEDMKVWSQMDQFTIGEKPAQGDEPAFKVRFDPNIEPSWAALREGVARDALGLVTVSMMGAKLWRTKNVSHDITLGAGSTKEFYEAASFIGHRMLVRDIAWAPGSVRGYDTIATVCKDGMVRIFEVHTPAKEKTAAAVDYTTYPETTPKNASSNADVQAITRSGIGAGLANTRIGPDDRIQDRTGCVRHEVKEVATLDLHRCPVWRCQFDEDGQVLGSCGDDGRVLLWRRKPHGGWALSAELGLIRG